MGWQDTGAALAAGGPLALAPLVAAVPLLGLDFLLGGFRLHLWVRRLQPGAGYGISLRTYLVNLFAAALSPMGAASGPAQLAALIRGGLAPARATAALLLNYVGILTAMVLVGTVAGTYLATTTPLGKSLGGRHPAVLLGALVLPVILVPAILSPRTGSALSQGLMAAGSRTGGGVGRAILRAGQALSRGMEDYTAAAQSVREGWRRTLAGGVALSSAMLLNRSTIGLLVALGLGFQGDYAGVIARQAIHTLALYFSPSPGGSGIAEASVPLFMGSVLPAGRSMEFTFLWRLITSYAGVAAGAVSAALVFAPARPRRVPPPVPPGETATDPPNSYDRIPPVGTSA